MKGESITSVYSEEQAINITIEHGFTGNELDTKVWKERQCLKPDRTLNALIDKLQTIYNNVQVTGSGKKRKYILTDKKEQQTERQFNYKGTVLSVEDETMQEYIFNYLINNKPSNHSFKGWANLINFPDPDKFDIEEMKVLIKKEHKYFTMPYNPNEVISNFIQTINTRNRDILERSFTRLEKAKRINVIERYHIKTTNNLYRDITKEEYENILKYIQEYLHNKGVSYFAYTQSLTSIHKTKQMNLIINQVKEYLSDKHEIEYIFKTFKPIVLDKTIKQEVTGEQFNNAYFKRLITLSNERQQKENYINSISFWKRYYLLNTLILLQYIGVKGIHKAIEDEKKNYNDKLDQFCTDMLIYESELKKQRSSFGNN